MTGVLLKATRRAAEAACDGDLEAVRNALDQRARARERATPEELAAAYAHGAAIAAFLQSLRNRIQLERTLLERQAVASVSHFDLTA